MRAEWHLVTSEFPPDVCGVGDQSYLLAKGLAEAGDEVHVYTRRTADPPPDLAGVSVHQVFTDYGRTDLDRLGEELDRHPAPRRLLVQWVPHGYGFRSLNLALAYWLFRRGRTGDDLVELIVHEPGLGWSSRDGLHFLAALVHRAMLTLALRGARKAWVTIPAWSARVKPYARRGLAIKWLPATSPVPVVDDSMRVLEIRQQFGSPAKVIGVFGKKPAIDRQFETIVVEILSQNPEAALVLMGAGSTEAADILRVSHPALRARIHSMGTLSSREVSLTIQACDVMLQLYPDGVNARRSSLLSSLANGAAIVTNEGDHTELMWRESEAVSLVKDEDRDTVVRAVNAILADLDGRKHLGRRARALFEKEFRLSNVISRLRNG